MGYYQIASLSSFLILGGLWGYIEWNGPKFLSFIGTSLLTQKISDQLRGSKWNWTSALISSLSLCLLLDVTHWSLACLAGAGAMLSKGIGFRQRHFFNPSGLIIVLSIWLFPQFFWVKQSQWGSDFVLIYLFLLSGLMVVKQVPSQIVSFTFLSSYLGLLILRVYYLELPLDLLWHQWSSIGLVVFSFFMISDPKTVPPSRQGKIVFALSVAGLASVLKFFFWIHEHLFTSLILVSLGWFLIVLIQAFFGATNRTFVNTAS